MPIIFLYLKAIININSKYNPGNVICSGDRLLHFHSLCP